MNTQQAQDLKRLAEAAQRICPIKQTPIKWFTESEMMMLEFHEDDGAFIAAMSPDVALSLLAERAMLIEALTKIAMTNAMDYEYQTWAYAAIEQCEQGTQP
jgi:hypothetical protein